MDNTFYATTKGLCSRTCEFLRGLVIYMIELDRSVWTQVIFNLPNLQHISNIFHSKIASMFEIFEWKIFEICCRLVRLKIIRFHKFSVSLKTDHCFHISSTFHGIVNNRIKILSHFVLWQKKFLSKWSTDVVDKMGKSYY